jgi:hypothetical protein
MPEPNSVTDREYSGDELLLLLNGKLFFVLESCPIGWCLFDPISFDTIT